MAARKVPESQRPQTVDIAVLLPHEILDALARAGREQVRFIQMFRIALLPVFLVYVGATEREGRAAILGSLPSARTVATSPSFSGGGGAAAEQCLASSGFSCLDAGGSIPLTFHCDGAEFYNETEYIVWSVGSFLATGIDVPRLFLFDCCDGSGLG